MPLSRTLLLLCDPEREKTASSNTTTRYCSYSSTNTSLLLSLPPSLPPSLQVTHVDDSIDPARDLETITGELCLKDLAYVAQQRALREADVKKNPQMKLPPMFFTVMDKVGRKRTCVRVGCGVCGVCDRLARLFAASYGFSLQDELTFLPPFRSSVHHFLPFPLLPSVCPSLLPSFLNSFLLPSFRRPRSFLRRTSLWVKRSGRRRRSRRLMS